ncbi:hypothetical protein J7J74_03155 [bacterium]|nr:hypothetical protein [bacterium]
MNKEKILKLINQIEEATEKLKLEIGIPAGKDVKKRKVKPRKRKKQKINLVGPVKILLDEGFFSDWKRDIEVIQKLKEKF